MANIEMSDQRAVGDEITPEMIKAGLEAISGFELLDAWEGHLGKTDLIIAIYTGMVLESRRLAV